MILFPQVRSDLLILCLLATSALCGGMLLNQFKETPLPLVYKFKAERMHDSVRRIASQQVVSAPTPVSRLPEQLSLEEFSSYVKNTQGVILDARAEPFHRLGHVPGALSLPRDEFEKGYAALKNKLEADRSQPIAIYCSDSSCEDSGLVKKALTSLGYTNLALFEGGWGAWTSAIETEEVAP